MRPRSATTIRSSSGGDNGAGNRSLSKTMKERDELLLRVKNLQDELKLALMAADDIAALKKKLTNSCILLDNSKSANLRTSSQVSRLKHKNIILSDHTERLIIELRIEQQARLRLSERERKWRLLKVKAVSQNKRLKQEVAAKDKLIRELRDNNHVLNNQLKLMDEQITHVRKNVDGIRVEQRVIVDKSVQVAKTLRHKYASATGRNLDDVTLHERGSATSPDASPTSYTAAESGRSPFSERLSGGKDDHTMSFSPSPGKVRPQSSPGPGKGERGTAKRNVRLSPEELQQKVNGMSERDSHKALDGIMDKIHEKQRKGRGENKVCMPLTLV
jgi:hypothetical protein